MRSSARKSQAISLQDLAQAVAHSDEGFAITDPEGNFLYINEAHLRMYGYDRAPELLGRPWTTLYTDEWVRHFRECVFPLMPQEKVWRGQVLGLRRDGSCFLAGVTLTMLPDGKITCSCRDESVRRHDASAARLARREALRELGERLIGSLPGRLQHPLEMLSSYSSFLLGEVQKGLQPDTDSLRTGLEEIDAAGRRFAEQLQRLDLVARLAARDELEESPSDEDSGTEWTSRLAAACRKRAEAAGRGNDLSVNLTADHLAIDYGSLESAVLELLGNALQSSHAGDAVRITGERAGGFYLLRVRDDGVGLPGSGWPDPRQRTLGQSSPCGFGLAVVRYLLQRSGGRLVRDAADGCTTCLSLHLPRHA